jgi:hypothetical protein
MKTVDTAGWKLEWVSMEEWNVRPGHRFAIIQQGDMFAGSQHDGPRLAVSNAGTVVAMEVEGLYTYCLIHPDALRLP